MRRRARGRRSPLRRAIRGAVLAKTALLAVALLAFTAIYLRIGMAPMRFEGLTERVTAALAERIGEDWSIALEDSAITLVDGAIGMKVAGLSIYDRDGALVARAPRALMSVSTWSLIAGDPLPRAIEFHDVQLRARIARDGSLSLAPPGATQLIPPASEDAEAVGEIEPVAFSPPPSLALALASFLRMTLDGDNPVGALDYARVVDASLLLVDESGRERVGFARVDARFANTPRGRRFDATFEGDAGAWELAGEVSRAADGGRDAAIQVTDVPVGDIVLFAGMSSLLGSDSLRLTGSARIGLDAEDHIRQFDARLASNAGSLSIDDPHLRTLAVEELSAIASWDPQRKRLIIPTLDYSSGRTLLRLSGEAEPADGEGGWRLALSGRDARLSGAAASDAPVAIDRVSLRARGGADGVFVEDLSLEGEEIDVAVALSYGSLEDQGGLRVGVEARETDVRAALRVWPKFVSPKPREFLVRSLEAGTLHRLSLAAVITGEGFASMRRKQGLTREALDIDFAISGATLRVNPDLPPMSELAVTGAVDGMGIDVEGQTGAIAMPDARRLSVSQGRFRIDDFWNRQAIAELDFRAEGAADALASFLRSPAIARSGRTAVSPEDVAGSVDLAVSIPLPINDIPAVEDLPIVVAGTVSDLSIASLLGEDELKDGAFGVDYRSGDLAVEGEALLSGEPAAITLTQLRGMPAEATISMTLDDAARARRGWALANAVRGRVPLIIRTVLDQGNSDGVKVEADITEASVENLVPGWVKPSGQPGALSFVLKKGDELLVEDLVVDAGPAQAQGSLRMSASGELREARFPSFRLSPGDSASVDVAREGDVWKVNVAGEVIDVRPFLKQIGAGSIGTGIGERRGLDLAMRASILTGHNGEAITNAQLDLSTRGGATRSLDFRGRFPDAEVAARTGVMPDGSPIILLESGDAGATLRFADLYTRMIGGDLTFQIASEGEPRPGIFLARNFLLRDEPALRRVVAQQVQSVGATRDGPPIDLAAARFTQARVDFIRNDERIDLLEAVLWGAEVGFKLDGFVDYEADYVDIKGTFVPAYGLNNVFAQVPLFGPILGGGRNEGLFGVNFRVSGQASAPNLTINPLSAIAPGFLRRFFGASGTPYRAPSAQLPPLEPAPPLSLAPQ